MTVSGMYMCMEILKWVQGNKYTQNHIFKAKNTPQSHTTAQTAGVYYIMQKV